MISPKKLFYLLKKLTVIISVLLAVAFFGRAVWANDYQITASDGRYNDQVSLAWVDDILSNRIYYIFRSSTGSVNCTASYNIGIKREAQGSTGTFHDSSTWPQSTSFGGQTNPPATAAASGVRYLYAIGRLDNSFWAAADPFNHLDCGTSVDYGWRAPAALPTNVMASDGAAGGGVQIDWTASVTDPSQVYYDIHRFTSQSNALNNVGATNLTTTAVGATTYTDTPPVAGTTYWYKVFSSNVSSASASGYWSTWPNGGIDSGYMTAAASFDYTIANGGNPAVMRGNSVDNTITLTRTAGTAVPLAFSYTSNAPAGAITNVAFTPTSCTASCSTTIRITTSSTATPGIYGITVWASASGAPAKSTQFSLTINSSATAAPTNLTASDGTYTHKVALSWTGVSGSVTSYPVYRSTTNQACSGTAITQGSAGTTYDDSPPLTGTTYYYSVKAKYTDGTLSACSNVDGGYMASSGGIDYWLSPYCSPSTACNPMAFSPAPKANGKYDSGTTVSITANPKSGSTFTGWCLGVGNTCSPNFAATNNPTTITMNSDKNVTAVFIQPPTNVQASDGAYTDKVRVTWTAAVNAGGYVVFRATGVNGTYFTLNSGNPTANTYFDDTTAVAGTTYWYKVASTPPGSLMISDLSAADSGWRSSPILQPPTNVQASDGTYTDKVRVTWSAASSATGYIVFRATNVNGAYLNLNPGNPTANTYFDDTTAVAGTTYWYKVASIVSNSNGTVMSDLSAADSGWRSSVPPTTYPIIIRGTSGSLSKTTSFTLTVTH
ncbi:MAG: hypothetical protein HYT48_02485 [Candidatus Vogelbacteria bacterium]|nr:hypothetical protein [Candidatus Vogelbacteria bacterium]